jgi:alcohol dehydrogenase
MAPHVMHRVKTALVGRLIGALDIERLIPKVKAGPGASRECGAAGKALGMTRALVVTDEILRKLGACDACVASLRAQGIECFFYDGVLPDPKVEQVLAGAKVYLDNKCDGIVAIGGGSSIDCAKVIGAYVKDPKPVEHFAGGMKCKKGIPPLIAVPTTHGTGSETTFAAVISSADRKMLVTDFKIMPKVAILDTDLVLGLPRAVSAATGMDALTHAVEAYLSPWATPAVVKRCEAAVPALMSSLVACYADGKNAAARAKVLQASFDAGVAINIGAVGYVHAIAHTVGFSHHVPHGAANAMILPHVLDFYGAAAHAKLARLARLSHIGAPADADAKLAKLFVQRVRDMQRDMAMETTVKGLTPQQIPALAKIALVEAHGERFSMWQLKEFMGDPGYPCIQHMELHDVEKVLRALLPGAPMAKL